MVTWDFDGIDLDWEYPVTGGLYEGTPDDTVNYTLLLQDFRDALDREGSGGLLTIAGPAGPDKIANMEPLAIAQEVDWINVMAYDFHGGWESRTHFNAPLAADSTFPAGATDPLTVQSTIQAWLGYGIDPDQLVLGMPLFGRGWSGVTATDDGLFQAASGLPMGSWEAGVWDYADVLTLESRDSYDRHWHEAAQVPWLYSAEDGVFITYDDADSIQAKMDYLVDMDLGGAMVWELDADVRPDHTLLTQIHGAMRPSEAPVLFRGP